MNEFLIQSDTSLFLWLNSAHAPYWDIFMKMASGKLIWGGMYLALLYALWRSYGWRTALAGVVAAALAVVIADQITASLLRPVFQRPRPANEESPIWELVHIVDGYRGGHYGFPSCHAANTFAVATLLGFIFNRWRFTMFIVIWALLNCYSRIYLGVHYPGDILAGFIVGCMAGSFTYLLFSAVLMVWKRSHPAGRTDRLLYGSFGGRRFRYRACDVPVAVGVITVVYIAILATSF